MNCSVLILRSECTKYENSTNILAGRIKISPTFLKISHAYHFYRAACFSTLICKSRKFLDRSCKLAKHLKYLKASTIKPAELKIYINLKCLER